MVKSKKSCIFVSPHPDDVELSCALAAQMFLTEGYQVLFVYVCSGELAGDPKEREQESITSARILGVKETKFLRYPQFSMFENRMMIKDDLEALASKFKPSIVFIPWEKDSHEDHVYTSRQSLVAFRGVGSIYFYPTPTSIEFNPDTILYTNNEMLDKKTRSLGAQKSQITTNRIDINHPKINSDYWKNLFGHHSRITSLGRAKDGVAVEVFKVSKQELRV